MTDMFEALAQGDLKVLGDVRDWLLPQAIKRVRGRDGLAQDVVQDVLAAIIKKVKEETWSPRKPAGYVATMMRNRATELLGSEHAEAEPLEDWAEIVAPAQATALDQANTMAELWRVVSRLEDDTGAPQGQRQALRRRAESLAGGDLAQLLRRDGKLAQTADKERIRLALESDAALQRRAIRGLEAGVKRAIQGQGTLQLEEAAVVDKLLYALRLRKPSRRKHETRHEDVAR